MTSTVALEPSPELRVRPDAPQNGLAGLKHWRHDIVSGIVVSLVSLPLSSGIAIASGVPPIYGLISAIIAGLIFSVYRWFVSNHRRPGRRLGTRPGGGDGFAGGCRRRHPCW